MLAVFLVQCTTDEGTIIPDTPTGVIISAGNRQLIISWDPVTEEESYNIYWNTTGEVDATASKIEGISSPYSHTGTTNGTTYYYIITAANQGGESLPSGIVSAVPNYTTDQLVKLAASDRQVFDYYGYSVSIAGDYAVVGSILEDGGIDDPFLSAGAVYVFYRTGVDTWGEVKKLVASDPQAQDQFGYSVSISGDYAIAGARQEDGGGEWHLDVPQVRGSEETYRSEFLKNLDS